MLMLRYAKIELSKFSSTNFLTFLKCGVPSLYLCIFVDLHCVSCILTDLFTDEEVTSVAVGQYHTVCGTASGNVYCWGDSTYSQCCSKEPTQYTTPHCVATFHSPVKKVCMQY